MNDADLESSGVLRERLHSGETPSHAGRPRGFADLGEVVLDECFPAVDLALRRGRHIHRDDERWYAFLTEAHALLETFYRRYGCELLQRSDGYFFLLPTSDDLGKRHLSIAEMIVGQGLALAYLDPHSVEKGGVIGREDLLGQLAAVMGTDALMHTLNPKRKRVDERVMQRNVRQKVSEALRRLAQLGFVQLLEGDQLRLPPSLMRFAEPVRGLEAPSEALAKLIERGEISLETDDEEAELSDDERSLAETDEGSDDDADAVPDEAHPKADASEDVASDVDASDVLDADALMAAAADFDLEWDTLEVPAAASLEAAPSDEDS